MKKSFLFGLLAIGLASFGFGGVSLADVVCSTLDGGDLPGGEFEAFAYIGGGESVACYTTLPAAISDASDGATVTLLGDVTLSSQLVIPEGKNIILDIGTFDIKAGNSTGNNILVNGSLTLTGTSGKIYSEDDYNSIHSFSMIEIYNGGHFIMNGGNIEAIRPDAVNKGQFGVGVYGEGSTVEINGGEIRAGWYAVTGNGKPGRGGTTVTVNGGRLISTTDYAIYNPQDGNLIINDGAYINGGAGGIVMNRGNLTINGGDIISTDLGDTGICGDGTCGLGKVAVYLNAEYGDVNFSIISGNIIGYESALSIANGTTHDIIGGVVGGIFSSDPTDYISTGYTVLEKESKFYVMSLAAAATDESNTANVQLPEGVTIKTGDNEAALMDLSDDISSAITANVPVDEEVLTGEIQDAGYQGVAVAGTVLLDFGGTATFSRPIAIRIPVTSTNPVKVKVKHGTDAYGYTGLTLNPDATCNADGSVASSAYQGEDVPVNGLFAVIYTCSASTFVAYTEAAIPTPSYGGGGSSSSYSCKNLPANAVANNTTKPKKNTDYSYSTDTGAVCTFQCKTGYAWNETDSKCEKADETVADDETNKDETTATVDTENSDTLATEDLQKVLEDGYNVEFHKAYEFAFQNGITTMPTIQEADMNGNLNRIAMAKMLSQYAINILGKTPDTTREVPNFPDVDAQLDADYNNGVTLAYQLGIMGINIDEFRPFDLVTRAEFGTALSRMLFGLADGEGDAYYSTHLEKLMSEGIITNDNPRLDELRGYVMIMLMRSASK